MAVLRERGRTASRRTVLAAVLLLCGALAVPLPYQVEARSELQPVVRRFVAEPFDGTLDQALVEPGETVEAGHLLARMDDREINRELAGIDAKRQPTSLERNTNPAKQDIGSAEISRDDVAQLELRRTLPGHRSDHLAIRSPIDGLDIVGDQERSEDVPLKTGDALFEIAPLDRLVIEVAIPEADLRHVRVGQDVSLILEAFPGEHWNGTLGRIHPRSEVREREHVFIGEVELENPGRRLRPGMQGRSKIATDQQPIGWILLHRPFEALMRRLGW